jgi:signal transduction histidine kinase/ActR/RegA family two-component response regulator
MQHRPEGLYSKLANYKASLPFSGESFSFFELYDYCQLASICRKARSCLGNLMNPGPHRGRNKASGFQVFKGLAAALLLILALQFPRSLQGQEAPAAPGEPSLLTNILDIRNLTLEQAQRRPKAHLRGTVVYRNPQYNDLFINDGRHGIYVGPLAPAVAGPAPVKLGSVLDLQGIVSPGDFSPSVEATSVIVSGPGELPEPIPCDYFAIASGKMDSEWVALRGLVVGFEQGRDTSELLIRIQGKTLQTLIPTQPGLPELSKLMWSEVSIRGVVSGMFSRQRGLTAPRLFCPGPEFVKAVANGAFNPAQSRPALIADLFTFDPKASRERGAKVEGVVTAVLGSRSFLLQDSSGALEARLISEAQVKPLEKVVVVGFPESELLFPRLVNAQLLSSERGELPPARQTTLPEILDGAHLGERVQMDATVRGKGFSLITGGPRFDLELGLPSAIHFPPGVKESSIPVGAKLRFKAAYILQTDIFQKTSKLLFFPSSPADIQILYKPNHLLNRNTVTLISLALLGAGVVFAWNNQLRSRVRAQTRELVAANETKSVFIRNISHEIRTPLHGIIGTADLLGRTQLNQEQFDFLRYLQRSAEGLLHLINDILDVSKIESGKLTLDIAPFDLRRTATEVVELLRPGADQKGLGLQLKVTGRLPASVAGDQFRIRQVLFNLLGNAVKFTDKGMVGLDLDVQAADLNQAVIKFLIHDTGAGISEQAQANLFKPFSQVDASSKRRFEGSGLGLVICRELVEMMGGDIQLESKLGAGSVFWFVLKFGIASGQADQPSSPSLSPAPIKKFEDLSILVAEDTALNAHLLRIMLQKFGCKHTFVTNGKEAMEAAQKERFDLVLMDCQMPVMDGLQSTTAIRQLPPGGPNDPAKLPIIALTASASAQHREQCFSVGMNDHMTKPFTASDLEKILARWGNAENSRGNGRPVATI